MQIYHLHDASFVTSRWYWAAALAHTLGSSNMKELMRRAMVLNIVKSNTFEVVKKMWKSHKEEGKLLLKYVHIRSAITWLIIAHNKERRTISFFFLLVARFRAGGNVVGPARSGTIALKNKRPNGKKQSRMVISELPYLRRWRFLSLRGKQI